mgnify:CR=1 FL=1
MIWGSNELHIHPLSGPRLVFWVSGLPVLVIEEINHFIYVLTSDKCDTKQGHAGVAVRTPELFLGWILFRHWELNSGVVSPYAIRKQICTRTIVSHNYEANHTSFLFKLANDYLGKT